jgi:hypothetical protein
VVGKQINGINIKVKHGLNGEMFFLDMTFLGMQFIKKCVEAQLGIKSIMLDIYICGDQMDGIPSGMRDMLGVVIGLIGISVIN